MALLLPALAPVPRALMFASFCVWPVPWAPSQALIAEFHGKPPLPPVLLLSVAITEYSWLPFTASVDVDVIRPAATFWICRSLPALPTETTPTGLVPAKPP